MPARGRDRRLAEPCAPPKDGEPATCRALLRPAASRITPRIALCVCAAVLTAVPAHAVSPVIAFRDDPVGAARPPASAGAPLAAVSRYMTTTNPARLWSLGCAMGRTAASNRRRWDALVVLAFGRPARKNRTMGTLIFGGGFRGLTAVRRAAQSYGRAFWRCSAAAPFAHLTLAVGTSNWGAQVSYAHGRAWAAMVNDANLWLQSVSAESKVEIVGADDIEPAWNTPRASVGWVRGYESLARWPYYDYGSADGCPPYGRCAGAWTMEDLWFVAWGSPNAWPLPEIYANNGANAAQWYALSVYSYHRHHQPVRFVGVMTQWNMCHLTRNPCWGIRNTPRQGWWQLQSRLNRDRRTAVQIRWTTDIGP
jgi:hypothetical protein